MGLEEMKYMMVAKFEDGSIELSTVLEDFNPYNHCKFYHVIPAYDNKIMKDDDFIACDTLEELKDELKGAYYYLIEIELKEMNS
jgi:hypothetical protein